MVARMGVKIKVLPGLFILSLLSVVSLAAPSGDLRLVVAVKERDKEAVRSLLQENADVNAQAGRWRDGAALGGSLG